MSKQFFDHNNIRYYFVHSHTLSFGVALLVCITLGTSLASLLQILDQPLRGRLECPFLGSLYRGVVLCAWNTSNGSRYTRKIIPRRTHQITAGSKSMVDTLKMDAAVSSSETCEF